MTVAFEPRGASYVLRFGRLSFPQSAFMVAAAAAIGLGGGLGAVVFRRMIDGAGWLAFSEILPFLHAHIGALGLVLVLALGGAIASYITVRFAPEAKGHGVPEVMEAVALRGGIMRPRVIAIKSLASATTIGFGGSCGREGPIVQIGSAIGSSLGQLVHAPTPIIRTLVACGAAAGISATFNAPIGGVFFASEVILGEFAPRSFAAIVVASVLAAVVGRAFFGDHPSFNAAAFFLASPWELVLYALLGVIAAVWATGFVKLLYGVEDLFERFGIPAALKGVIGFSCVGLIGIWFPQVLGVGYISIQQVLYEHVAAPHAFLLAAVKPLTTALTLGSGGSGGVFAPSLFIGAFLGDSYGRLVHALFPLWTGPAAAYGLVAMAALFAAAAEAPITAIMIIFEMSNDYTIILPLMVAVVIATLLGRRLMGATVYEQKLLRRGIDWKQARNPRFFTKLSVANFTRMPPIVAQIDERISSVIARDCKENELAIPVCEGSNFIGVVTALDLAHALAAYHGDATIGSILHLRPATLSETDTLDRAASLMAEVDTPLLPVISEHDGALLGVLTRRDLLEAYRTGSER